MKFLIVDDERDVEILFRQKLRLEVREGLFELVFAFSGKQALELLRSRQPPEVMCFHGMRAGNSPINVEISLNLNPGIHEVPLIREDFTRVIINLCNNAFDAMRDKNEKAKVKGEKYLPELTIRTKADHGKVLIEIADNDPGISDEIKDKILQPFFTTKKGTEGTGLGLSITHDIVKAHGGQLKVSSQVGEGTTIITDLLKMN